MDAGFHRPLQLQREEKSTMNMMDQSRGRSMGLIGRLGVGRSTTVSMGVGSDSARRREGDFGLC